MSERGRDPMDILGPAPDDVADQAELLEFVRSCGFADEIKTLILDTEHRKPERERALRQLEAMDRDQRVMFLLVRNHVMLHQIEKARRQTDERFRELKRRHDEIMSGESKSGCRHLTQTEHALDRRILVIETKAAIYAGIVSIIVSPIVAAIISVMMAYVTGGRTH